MIMEAMPLNLQSKIEIISYRDENHLVKYEYGILDELIKTIDNGDMEMLSWFGQFGDRIRSITMNVHAYRKSLEFGFTEIAFDQHDFVLQECAEELKAPMIRFEREVKAVAHFVAGVAIASAPKQCVPLADAETMLEIDVIRVAVFAKNCGVAIRAVVIRLQ